MARRHRRGRPVHGILLLDKPSGGSSNHALQKAKRIFGAAKAGHTGSLDPLATGMLPICFGEATKLAGFLLDADKGYETTLKLGVTTNSADADGEVLETRSVPTGLDLAQFEAICKRFTGPLMQVPPMVSAIKIDGKRLYKLAREGKEVDRPARPVVIHELEVLSFSGDSARLAVRCSKGTYIRSLVTDIGEAIGCGAHVTALRRTFVSPFGQLPMISLDTLEKMMASVPDDAPAPQTQGAESSNPTSPAAHLLEDKHSTPESANAQSDVSALWPVLDSLLLPPDAGLGHMPRLTLDEQGTAAFLHGNAAACTVDNETPAEAGSLCRVYEFSGLLLGLGELSDTGTVSPRRVLQWG